MAINASLLDQGSNNAINTTSVSTVDSISPAADSSTSSLEDCDLVSQLEAAYAARLHAVADQVSALRFYTETLGLEPEGPYRRARASDEGRRG